MTKIRRLTGPDGLRAPVSASATRFSSASREAVGAVLSLLHRPLQRQAARCGAARCRLPNYIQPFSL
jgi:hypothetical protein